MRVVENAEGGAPIGTPWEIKGIDTKLPKPAIESLLREDPNGNYSGWLAEAWNVDPAKNTLTLTLAKGVNSRTARTSTRRPSSGISSMRSTPKMSPAGTPSTSSTTRPCASTSRPIKTTISVPYPGPPSAE